jgi:hypothetical protein
MGKNDKVRAFCDMSFEPRAAVTRQHKMQTGAQALHV